MTEKKFNSIKNIQHFVIVMLLINLVACQISWSMVPSESMYPTLEVGTALITEKNPQDITYDDIIVFFPYAQANHSFGIIPDIYHRIHKDTLYVKRVVGLPGDTIEVKDGYLYRNGEKIVSDYTNEELINSDYGPFTVSDDCYFMMGDNRNNSYDSRYIGEINSSHIYGRVIKNF